MEVDSDPGERAIKDNLQDHILESGNLGDCGHRRRKVVDTRRVMGTGPDASRSHGREAQWALRRYTVPPPLSGAILHGNEQLTVLEWLPPSGL